MGLEMGCLLFKEEVVDFNGLVTLLRLCRKFESIRTSFLKLQKKYSSPQTAVKIFAITVQRHLFPEYKYSKIRVFCYRWGELGQLATPCTKCRQAQGSQLTCPSIPSNFPLGGRLIQIYVKNCIQFENYVLVYLQIWLEGEDEQILYQYLEAMTIFTMKQFHMRTSHELLVI